MSDDGGGARGLRIAIVVGSTRAVRRSPVVARWVLDRARARTDAAFDVVDLADHDLPFFDEPEAPLSGRYAHEHTRRWAAVVETFDGYVFVVPEYNHAAPAVLKNAIDFLFAEWNDKACGFVTYGADPGGGVRAAEHLRLVVADLKVATVRAQVALSARDDWSDRADPGSFAPRAPHLRRLDALLDEVVAWSGALRTLRAPAPQDAAAASG